MRGCDDVIELGEFPIGGGFFREHIQRGSCDLAAGQRFVECGFGTKKAGAA